MDEEESYPRHGARALEIDGIEHNVFREHIPAAELFDLAGKSPDEWEICAELQGGGEMTVSLDDEIELHSGRTAVFRTRRRGHGHRPEGCELTVVVASDPVRLEVTKSTLLVDVVRDALAKAAAAGRERDDWQLKTEAGVVLDIGATIEQAGIECGSVLFLSLKAGAAGDASIELLVDPAVSASKFDTEVSAFRALERMHSSRGTWLIRAEFPAVFIVFGAPNAKPLRMIAFGAAIDFSNYDLWAPSVRIVDPITEAPYTGSELQPQAQLLRRVPMAAAAGGVPGGTFEIGKFMVWQEPGEVPFLCHPGVREYHRHPAHTGDDWLLHRGRGEGTLARIVDLLFHYGSAAMTGISVMPAVGLPPE